VIVAWEARAIRSRVRRIAVQTGAPGKLLVQPVRRVASEHLAAGMSLFDTADGCFMNFAYDWAFARPVRKVY
jgi:high-affinity nickel permease